MKMLVERTAVATAAPFDLEAAKLYFRFDGGELDTEISNLCFAAAEEIEHFGQIALLTQTIRVTVFDLEHDEGLALPIGPVPNGAAAAVQVDGQPFTDFELVTGARPYLIWPVTVRGKASARVVVEYPAGFGDAAEDVPKDLAQAILDQAALIFGERGSTDAKALGRSVQLARVGARYRGVSL